MVNVILGFGIAVIAGFLFARMANKLKLPSVTGYIISGIIIGPHVLNLVPEKILNASSIISGIALSFVAFSLGEGFTLREMRKIGKLVLFISIGEVLGAFLLVTLSLYLLLRLPLSTAMVIGAIAPATAPAAVLMIVRETKAKGIFTNTLLGVVAIDDAWGIILFSFTLALARAMMGTHGMVLDHTAHYIFHGFMEVVGSLVLGLLMGFLFSLFFRFLDIPSHIMVYVIGFVLLTGGIAMELHLSILLANMVLGATVANLVPHSRKAFDSLKGFETPLYLLFFVLAGASLEIGNLKELGLVGIIYVLTRLPGEMLGAYIGSVLAKAPESVRKYMGLGLAPQAGVAIGLALIAKISLPQGGDLVLSTIIVTTVIYELLGPPLVKIALHRAGEIS